MNGKPVHVAVGVIENEQGEILIAKRHAHQHMGGLWEFPGGKVEQGESVYTALHRELAEEINLVLGSSEPLIRIPYHYPDKSVLLDVHRVKQFTGEAQGLEGQEIRWVKKTALADYHFPPANRPILNAVTLPDSLLITGKFHDSSDFQQRLSEALSTGIKLIQLRAKDEQQETLIELVHLAKSLCQKYSAKLMLNGSVELALSLDTDGVHLDSQRLREYVERPVAENKWLGVSVHNTEELVLANKIAADYTVIAPVLPTNSHPGAPTLGWDAFQRLTEQATMPVYALGGMTEQHRQQANISGAQGIAGISLWWKQDER